MKDKDIIYYLLSVIQFILVKCLIMDISDASRSRLNSIKKDVDFEIKIYTDLPF